MPDARLARTGHDYVPDEESSLCPACNLEQIAQLATDRGLASGRSPASEISHILFLLFGQFCADHLRYE